MVEQDPVTHTAIKKEIDDVKSRVTVIETILTRLETNHLAHIEKDMDKLSDSISQISGRLWGLVLVGLTQALSVIGGLIYLIVK